MCCASHAVADAPTCCKREPNEPVDLAELGRIGVLYFELPKEDRIAHVDKIAKERDYKNRDELTISRDKLPNYEEKIKIFFNEYGAAGPMNSALLRLWAHGWSLCGHVVRGPDCSDRHIHEDEEIRCILDGSGYFDVRDQNDRWVRIQVSSGDLIILVREPTSDRRRQPRRR